MFKEDLAIQSDVKRILNRSNIDYSEIVFGSMNRVVYFQGYFRVRAVHVHGDSDLNKYMRTQEYIIRTLFTLERRVKSIPGVKDVVFQLLNWKKGKGRWTRIEAEMGRSQLSAENHAMN